MKKGGPVNLIFRVRRELAKRLWENLAREYKDFVEISAVTSGKKDVERVVERARQNWNLKLRTVLFVDDSSFQ